MTSVPATSRNEHSAKPVEPEFVQTLPGGYSDIAGWYQADHSEAFAVFQATCGVLLENPPHQRRLGLDPEDLLDLCRLAVDPATIEVGSGDRARDFFENHFDPVVVRDDAGERAGFFTGYFEPTVAASRTQSEQYPVPLYRRPHDLVRTKDVDLPVGWDPDMRFARAGPDGVRPYPDRVEIEAGALRGCGLELAYVESWIEAFFIHIQGSAQLRFADRSLMRVAYAAKNGRPYTAIGRLLIAAGTLDKASMTMQVLRQWLQDNPDEGLALMRRNASFIFFREVEGLRPGDGPVGAAGVQLRAGTSLAVDRTWHLFGTPVWVDVAADETPADQQANSENDRIWKGHQGLMIAQDTGSAIVGPTRADLFIGTGPDAGDQAGLIKHPGRFVILWPKPAGGRGGQP